MTPDAKARKSWLEAPAFYAGRVTVAVFKIVGVKPKTIEAAAVWVGAIGLLIVLMIAGAIIDAYHSIIALGVVAAFLISIACGYSWDDRKSRPPNFTPEEIKDFQQRIMKDEPLGRDLPLREPSDTAQAPRP